MKVLKPYDQLYKTDKTYVLLKSGRNGGKSKAVAQYIVRKFLQDEGDFIVTRAYSQDLRDSMYAEILTVLQEIDNEQGTRIYEHIKTGSRPLKIRNKLNGNTISFMGIGGPDVDRTKGVKPDKDYQAVVVEEMQQIKSENNLNEALETFIRNMRDDAKVIMMFNPPRLASHWTNEMYRLKDKNSDEYLTLSTSYKNIAKVLNKHTLSRILSEKEVNPSEYRYRFLGETEGLFGSVYASFDRKLHFIGEDFARQMAKKVGVHSFVIGADPAATRDATALVPKFILNNGQIIVPPYFFHDPKKSGTIPNAKLAPIIKEWIFWLIKDWDLNPNMRIHMVFDTNGISQDLMNTINYTFPRNVMTRIFSQKKVIEMADIVKDAFSRNLVFIVDSGGYYNFIKNTDKHEWKFTTDNFVIGIHHGITQLEHVVWNENGDGFDKNVPNDWTDAFTYGLVFYLKNKGNLYFPIPERYYTPKLEEDREVEG